MRPSWRAVSNEGVFPAPPETNGVVTLTSNTQAVYEHLKHHGASFFVDIIAGTNLLPSMVEEAFGNAVVMGRRTWLTLKGPLKDRQNIVLTRAFAAPRRYA